MRTAFTIFAIALACSASSYAADAKRDVIPAGMMKYVSTEPKHILEFYAELSGMKLVTASHVPRVTHRITLHPQVALTRAEVTRLLEKTLMEQAGIIITKLDSQRASVTYNDALPITRPDAK